MDSDDVDITSTLVFPVIQDRGLVFLGRRIQGIGVGMWSGWDGTVGEKETVREAATKGFRSGSGLIANPAKLIHVGRIKFHNQDRGGTRTVNLIHAFLLYEWGGKFRINHKINYPGWFRVKELPTWKMMLADIYWIPPVLQGKKINGEFWCGPGQKTIYRREVEIVRDLGGIE